MGALTYPQFLTSGKAGIPAIQGKAGAFKNEVLAVLDAFLVTGCAFATAASQVISEETIVITFGVTHSYSIHQFVTIAGASSPELNGNHRVIAVTTTTITIARGLVTDVTGSLAVNITPLGWESMFGTADASRRAYRSADLTSSRSVLYLDTNYVDTVINGTGGRSVKVAVCEDMTTVGVPVRPYTSPVGTGDGVHHWLTAIDTYPSIALTSGLSNRDWFLIGDGKVFYFFIGCQASSAYSHYKNVAMVYMFGDVTSRTLDKDPAVVLGSSYVSVDTLKVNSSSRLPCEWYNPTGRFQGASTVGLHIMTRRPLEENTIASCSFLGLVEVDPTSPAAFGRSGREGGLDRLGTTGDMGIVFVPMSIATLSPNTFIGRLPYLRSLITDLTVSASSPQFHKVVQALHTLILTPGGVQNNGQGPTNWAYLGVDLGSPISEENI